MPLTFLLHERLSLLISRLSQMRRFFARETSISIGRNPGLVDPGSRPLRPMPINPTWKDVVHRDQDEQDQAGRDAEHRDPYRKQVDEWRRQISSGCPLHQAWIDIPGMSLTFLISFSYLRAVATSLSPCVITASRLFQLRPGASWQMLQGGGQAPGHQNAPQGHPGEVPAPLQ